MYMCVHIQIHSGVIIEDFESLSCFGFYGASALSLSEDLGFRAQVLGFMAQVLGFRV